MWHKFTSWLREDHLTDEQRVERLRKFISSWDKTRPWQIAFGIVMMLAVVGLIAAFTVLLQKFMNLGAQPNVVGFAWLGLGLGIILGVKFGFLIHAVIHQLFFATSAFHKERMLLRYYDTVQEYRRVTGADCVSESNNEVAPRLLRATAET